MAFALTAAYAYPVLIKSPTGARKGDQVLELEFTATAADVDLDIGDLSGTFWSAVDATDMGAAVLAAVTLLYPQFDDVGCQLIESVQLLPLLQSAAAAGAGEYAVAINSTTKLPEITLHAGEGITTGQIKMVCRLNNSELGMTFAYPPTP